MPLRNIGLVAFGHVYPEQSAAETRVLLAQGHPSLPDDEYGLLEAYCPDPDCDCRRVMLNVVGRRQQAVLAAINYGFDRNAEWAGPMLDPLNRQSRHASVLLSLVEQALADRAYVARLEAHYHQVKKAAADPSHPVQPLLARLVEEEFEETAAHEADRKGTAPGKGSKLAQRRSRGLSDPERGTPVGQPRKESVPKQLRPLFETVTNITDAFCMQHLNDEYAQLCRKLAAALCRKRPSPLTQGKIETWACAIVYAMGSTNFLFDKSQTPHITAVELCQLLGVSKNTASAKARMILDMFGIGPLDPRWCLSSTLADNPVAWMIEVNGFVVDVRDAPREIQEEAFRRGLIPYLP